MPTPLPAQQQKVPLKPVLSRQPSLMSPKPSAIQVRPSDRALDVEVKSDELDDFIIMRSNGAPTYHFAVVIDDFESGITHVMRGDDHLKNTARHIQLMEAFSYPIPDFVHLPMILGPDGARLSKRHGAMNVLHYRDCTKFTTLFKKNRLINVAEVLK